MVKVKAICRNEKEYEKQTNGQIQKVQRAPASDSAAANVLHPFQMAREHKRAVNAVKLEKVFAKPFLAAMSEHSDGVTVMAKNKYNFVDMLSGSADGEIIFWNIPDRRPVFQINAHMQFVRGLTFANNNALAADTIFVSAGGDKKIHLWSTNRLKEEYRVYQAAQEQVGSMIVQTESAANATKNYTPRATYVSK